MILDEIVKATKNRVEELKEKEMFPFEKALREKTMSFICEVKKASPSKGVIAKEFNPIQIAKNYQESGATAISVLTEPNFFQGSNQYLIDIKKEVQIPILRKDFIIDEIQIYESHQMGADAILLICSILKEEQLSQYIRLAHTLSMSCLVETHTEKEIQMAIKAGARIIGVNNRDLTTFEENIHHSISLRNYIPKSILFISESGIKTKEDVTLLKRFGVDGVLIGEALMRGATLEQLKGSKEIESEIVEIKEDNYDKD